MAGPPPAGEWIVAGGLGRAIRLGPTRSEVSFLLLAPQWTPVLGHRVEWVIEGHLARYFDPDARLGGWSLSEPEFTREPLSLPPFLSLGAGFA